MKRFGLKHLALAALVVACIFPVAGHALDIKISGQVNQLAMYADDGDKSDLLIGDNDNASSRISFEGKEDFGAISAGVTLEFEGEVNSSSKMTIEQFDDGDFNWGTRKVEGYFSGGFGKVSIGQGDGAANGTTEVDLSGTKVIMYSDTTTTSKSLAWKNSDGSAYHDLNVGDTRDNYDGLSRNQRVRYDSPTFLGITLSGSVTNGGAFELAARYSAGFYGKMSFAVGYVSTQNREKSGSELDFNQIGGSVSWLMPFGLNFTVAAAQQDKLDESKPDPINYYGKVGYKFGIHALAVEYGVTNDKKHEDDISTNYGLAYVVKPWKNIELFAAVRQFVLDGDDDLYGDDPEAITQAMAGTRIKF